MRFVCNIITWNHLKVKIRELMVNVTGKFSGVNQEPSTSNVIIMNINKLIQIAHKIINLKSKSTKEKVQTHVKSSQQNRVCPLGGFLRGLPELFLRGVPVHRTDPEQAVAELLGDVGEISGLRADNHSVINQTEMLNTALPSNCSQNSHFIIAISLLTTVAYFFLRFEFPFPLFSNHLSQFFFR